MTEVDWLGGKDPDAMLRHACGKMPPGLLARLGLAGTPGSGSGVYRASGRKLRLFACACCRRVEGLLPDDRCRALLDAAEAFADGLIGQDRLKEAEAAAHDAIEAARSRSLALSSGVSLWGTLTAVRTPVTAASAVLFAAGGAAEEAVADAVRAATESAAASPEAARWAAFALGWAARVRLLHDVFGNPFKRAEADPAWLAYGDGLVRKMAAAIYAERAFDRLPILADALEDAGCDDAEVLAHCRGPGPHVPGCWLLDLLVGLK